MGKNLKIASKPKKPKKCKLKSCNNERKYGSYCSFKCSDEARKERARNKKKGLKHIKSAKPDKEYMDSLWFEAVKAKSGYTCEYSGVKGKQIDPDGKIICGHHLLGKPNLYLRWSLDNGICITCGVHVYTAHQPSRKEGFDIRASEIKGFDIHAKLGQYVKSSPKVDLYEKEKELLAVIEKYKRD